MTLTVVCLALVALLSAACHSSMPEGQIVQADVPRVASPDASDAQLAQLTAGNNASAFDLYHTIATKEKGNLITSPYSISLAFSMIYAGAQGEGDDRRPAFSVCHRCPGKGRDPLSWASARPGRRLRYGREARDEIQV